MEATSSVLASQETMTQNSGTELPPKHLFSVAQLLHVKQIDKCKGLFTPKESENKSEKDKKK